MSLVLLASAFPNFPSLQDEMQSHHKACCELWQLQGVAPVALALLVLQCRAKQVGSLSLLLTSLTAFGPFEPLRSQWRQLAPGPQKMTHNTAVQRRVA